MHTKCNPTARDRSRLSASADDKPGRQHNPKLFGLTMIWCMAFVLFSTLTLLCVAIYPRPWDAFCNWVVWRFDRMRDYAFYWRLRFEEWLRERV